MFVFYFLSFYFFESSDVFESRPKVSLSSIKRNDEKTKKEKKVICEDHFFFFGKIFMDVERKNCKEDFSIKSKIFWRNSNHKKLLKQ